MNTYDAREICALFDRGVNIMQWINGREQSDKNSSTAILYSYDAQAGSYTESLKNPDVQRAKEEMGRYIASLLDQISPASILDAGTGEASSLVPILNHMTSKSKQVLGFDVSLSRVLYARRHLEASGYSETHLFTARLDRIPLATGSVDTVLTVHAVEPNHGHEMAILTELLRVARRYVVLVEPSYETANSDARARMDRLGYVRGLPQILKGLGFAPRVELLPYNLNPSNPAAAIVVEKSAASEDILTSAPVFNSPLSGASLRRLPDCWHCSEDGHAFPIVFGVPIFTVENAILASKLERFV